MRSAPRPTACGDRAVIVGRRPGSWSSARSPPARPGLSDDQTVGRSRALGLTPGPAPGRALGRIGVARARGRPSWRPAVADARLRHLPHGLRRAASSPNPASGSSPGPLGRRRSSSSLGLLAWVGAVLLVGARRRAPPPPASLVRSAGLPDGLGRRRPWACASPSPDTRATPGHQHAGRRPGRTRSPPSSPPGPSPPAWTTCSTIPLGRASRSTLAIGPGRWARSPTTIVDHARRRRGRRRADPAWATSGSSVGDARPRPHRLPSRCGVSSAFGSSRVSAPIARRRGRPRAEGRRTSSGSGSATTSPSQRRRRPPTARRGAGRGSRGRRRRRPGRGRPGRRRDVSDPSTRNATLDVHRHRLPRRGPHADSRRGPPVRASSASRVGSRGQSQR